MNQSLLAGLDTNGRAALLREFFGELAGNGTDAYDPTVVRTGDKLIIPEGANLPDVIASLQRQHREDEQVVAISVKLPVSPWDGAHALVTAIRERLGHAEQQMCSCGNPDCGAKKISVQIGLNESLEIPWGTFHLPGMDNATAEMGTSEEDDGRVVFQVNVRCKRKFEARIRRLLDAVRENALKNSLHKGKAFSMQFTDEFGDAINMPEPKFFDLGMEDPLFNTELTEAIERNIFVPIRDTEAYEAMGETVKQGILAAGIYGVGKTLLANMVARFAIKHGWTFIYVKKADDLEEALRFSALYEPAVVFVEDGERIAGEDRTDDVNDLVNEMDGVDGKTRRVITILTTNHPEKVNPAMRRPGRIDLVLNIEPPNAETVQRMLRSFLGEWLDPNADLTEVGKKLNGKIPAAIRETVKRSKKELLRQGGNATQKVTTDHLLKAADDVISEGNLFRAAPKDGDHPLEKIGEGLSRAGEALQHHSRNGHRSSNGHLANAQS